MSNVRYTNTNDIGVAILNLRIPKDLGWICRDITKSDVGIDATIEQVVDGKPTAKYISIQLKTGKGNVYEDKAGNFIYYIDDIHYDYWRSSSIPVILAYCNPKEEIIYWALLKKCNISRTSEIKGSYKIKILKSNKLNKDSLEELNKIIDTYQADFELPEMDEEDICDVNLWIELLENCAEVISNNRLVLEQLDKKYKRHNGEMLQFLKVYRDGVDKKIADKQVIKHAKAFEVAINMCKMQFKGQIPIVAQTHIEAIRLAERAMNNGCQMPIEINFLLQKELNNEIEIIKVLKEKLILAIERFENSVSPTINLRRAEGSFAQILKDYNAEMESIIYWIEKLIGTLKS